MNTDYLRYFSTLAELQHYGNAAKELNISQPGLSHAIHSLEKDYGLPLFEKTGRNVRLSPYGLEIKKYIDVILNNLDELEQTISDFHREDKIIRIASVYPLYQKLHSGTDPILFFEVSICNLQWNDPGYSSRSGNYDL